MHCGCVAVQALFPLLPLLGPDIVNDSACSIAEGEFGILRIAFSQLYYSLLERWCDGILCRLGTINGPSCLEVEEFVSASRISHRTELHAWGSVGCVYDV